MIASRWLNINVYNLTAMCVPLLLLLHNCPPMANWLIKDFFVRGARVRGAFESVVAATKEQHSTLHCTLNCSDKQTDDDHWSLFFFFSSSETTQEQQWASTLRQSDISIINIYWQSTLAMVVAVWAGCLCWLSFSRHRTLHFSFTHSFSLSLSSKVTAQKQQQWGGRLRHRCQPASHPALPLLLCNHFVGNRFGGGTQTHSILSSTRTGLYCTFPLSMTLCCPLIVLLMLMPASDVNLSHGTAPRYFRWQCRSASASTTTDSSLSCFPIGHVILLPSPLSNRVNGPLDIRSGLLPDRWQQTIDGRWRESAVDAPLPVVLSLGTSWCSR